MKAPSLEWVPVAEPSEELEGFCRRQYPQLVGTLSLYCGDVHLAEELAQDALATACARWSEVSQMVAPGPWVHRVAINAANSYWRRRRAARRAVDHLEEESDGHHTDPDVAARIAVRAAVSGLPERQRTAVVLRYFADMSAAEVGAIMDVSAQAVRNLTHRGLQRLREQIGPTSTAEEVSDVG